MFFFFKDTVKNANYLEKKLLFTISDLSQYFQTSRVKSKPSIKNDNNKSIENNWVASTVKMIVVRLVIKLYLILLLPIFRCFLPFFTIKTRTFLSIARVTFFYQQEGEIHFKLFFKIEKYEKILINIMIHLLFQIITRKNY